MFRPPLSYKELGVNSCLVDADDVRITSWHDEPIHNAALRHAAHASQMPPRCVEVSKKVLDTYDAWMVLEDTTYSREVFDQRVIACQKFDDARKDLRALLAEIERESGK